jgi:6-phosphogluconolactonase
MNRLAYPKTLQAYIRSFFSLLAVVVISLLTLSVEAADHKYIVYIGTYTGGDSKGIYAYRFDAISGEVNPIGLVAESENPSFLAVHPSGRFLYAVNEIDQFGGEKSGSISAFSIDRNTGNLTLLNRVSSLGAGTAHLSLDKTGRYLLVANYGGGSVAAFPIHDDGSLGKASSFVQHAGSSVNPERQTGPHAHEIIATNDNRFVLVPDLGLDEVLIYRFNAAKGLLSPNDPAFAKTAPGAGPRHVAVHPTGRFVYVVNEMQSTVSAFSYDAHAGSMRHIETLTTLPKDFTGQNSTAEILADAKGRFLYLSNRGHDSIAVFAINPHNGTLSPIQDAPTGGKTPRNFAIDPTGAWLFAANQESNTITLFRVDSHTGRLTRTQSVLRTGKPVCVAFIPEAR